jgi:hypothetical protein
MKIKICRLLSLAFFTLVIALPLANLPVRAQSSGASSLTPDGPLTQQQVFTLLRRSVGREMTEGDLAALIERLGIAFDPKPEIISRLRFMGAHPHLINAIKRAAEKMSAGTGEVISIRQAESDPLIEEVRKNVLEYSEELPDFLCNQEITRHFDTDGTGAWEKYDELTYEVSYTNRQDNYKPLNGIGRPRTLPLDQVGGGSSTGDFGSRLVSLFKPETKAIFKPAGTEKLGVRQAWIYDFRVPLASSELKIKAESYPAITAGYSGSVWIDKETRKILRLESAADNLPRDYPVTQAETATDYDMVKLRGLDVEFMLPIRTEFVIADRRKKQSFRNISYYKFYRKFETNVKVTDGDDPDKP